MMEEERTSPTDSIVKLARQSVANKYQTCLKISKSGSFFFFIPPPHPFSYEITTKGGAERSREVDCGGATTGALIPCDCTERAMYRGGRPNSIGMMQSPRRSCRGVRAGSIIPTNNITSDDDVSLDSTAHAGVGGQGGIECWAKEGA